MATPCNNSYLAYKHDTSRLLYWLIHNSNSIIRAAAAPASPAPPTSSKPAPGPSTLNTTGQIPVSELVPLANLIASHLKPIPSAIYALFRSVIAARTAFNQVFQMAAGTDKGMLKSNEKHKHFIEQLEAAFEALGGKEWMEKETRGADGGDEEDIEEVIFSNKFDALQLGDNEEHQEGEEGSDEDSDDDEQVKSPTTQQRQRRQKGGAKGKKGARAKKGKKKKKKTHHQNKKPEDVTGLDEVPLESYKIIEDTEGNITEYLMACYALVQEWGTLRSHVRGLWEEVAYEGLNSAVAGAVSNMAVSMVRESSLQVFVEFPGHDSYETVMNTITRGDAEKAQGMFHINLYQIPKGGTGEEEPRIVREVDVDVKEQFMIHVYNDLMDFVTDFQKSRSGKPTKGMLAEIDRWDPKFDLQRATNEERIKWRRAYTINWLYDLVNIFSSIVVQRNTLKGEKHVYDRVNWSPTGPWNEHRRLFGLVEFAGEITTLAMQRQGTDVRKKIYPHIVFQLQCIVDSLCVSQGWSLGSLRGHILKPPAKKFRPRRDIDLFLDREKKRSLDGKGYLQAVDIIRQLLQKEGESRGNPNRYKSIDDLLEGMQYDFINWLGESMYMNGLQTIPPSRFSNTNSNGLWEYSPYLCGVGLVEALELSYTIGMLLWDRIHEPFLLIHLHNALVQKGFIDRPVGLYSTLEELLPEVFFVDGKIPTKNFIDAFINRMSVIQNRKAETQRRAISLTSARATDVHNILNLEANCFFKTSSNLKIYRKVNWNPMRVPEAEIPLKTALAYLRLGLTKHVFHPSEPGGFRMADTDLVRRVRAAGLMSEQDMLSLSAMHNQMKDSYEAGADPNTRKFMQKTLTDMRSSVSDAALAESSAEKWKKLTSDSIPRTVLLECLKLDVQADVCGDRPLSSFNHLWMTVVFFMLWSQIEKKLEERRNPLYVECYETDIQLMRERRVSLTNLVLQVEDEECLKIIAEAFTSPRAGFMDHIYWDDLETVQEMRERKQRNKVREEDDEPEDACVIM